MSSRRPRSSLCDTALDMRHPFVSSDILRAGGGTRRASGSRRLRGMGSLSIGHWLIALAIVALIFGTRKLRDLGADLGNGMRGFKDAVREGAEKKDP